MKDVTITVNETVGESKEKRCVICNTSFLVGEDPYEENMEIIISPCSCLECANCSEHSDK